MKKLLPIILAIAFAVPCYAAQPYLASTLGEVAFSSTTLTMSVAVRDYTFNGTTATWTLPPISGNIGVSFNVKNRGSGNLTIQRAGSDNLYDTSSVTTFVVAAGASCRIVCDGGFWNVATSSSTGGGAPTTATYITQTSDGTLSAEQALSSLSTGLVKVTTGTGVLSAAVAGTDYQAADADLTAIAALSGTNNIYYRSAANTWSSVTIGSGLDFTAGTLTSTSGAPTGATYITQTSDGTLSAEQALSSLSTGFLKNTTGTGVLSITTDGTGLSISGSNITTGTVPAARGGAGTINGILKADGAGTVSLASAPADYYKTGSTTSPPMIVGLYGYGAAAQSPADSTTYYFGAPCAMQAATAQLTTTSARRRFYFPSAGTITKAYITVVNEGGTAGTSETSTLSLRLNDTTDTTLSSSIVTNATGAFNNTGISIAIAAGDYVECKWVTPAWATNPTNIQFSVQLEFRP